MPRRINAEIDMQILRDIGLGLLHKEIADKYDVSPSYVSKVARGKKIPDFYFPDPANLMHGRSIETYEKDIEAIIQSVARRKIIVDKDDILEHLNSEIQNAIIKIKVNLELIKKYKKGE